VRTQEELISKMNSLISCCVAVLSLESQAIFNTDSGWLYAGGRSRLVRFVAASDAPDQPDTFFPAPQTSGFIFIKDDTFTISVAEPFGSAQLEYKRGVLTKTGLGDFVSRKGERIKFEEALSSALRETLCDSLGDYCRELLANRTSATTPQTIHGTRFEAVLGKGRGALQKFTELTGTARLPGTSKRTVCTFTVLIGRRD